MKSLVNGISRRRNKVSVSITLVKHMFEGETMDEKLEINQENLNSLFKNEEK